MHDYSFSNPKTTPNHCPTHGTAASPPKLKADIAELLKQLGLPPDHNEKLEQQMKAEQRAKAAVATPADLSRVHISDLERGVREVGLYKLRKIARAFETTMSRLLTGL
jgi:transcriptional regulator with XRE-family HTH domain